jgi:hypothetical protein
MLIRPPNAAKCCKNAGKFFPDERKEYPILTIGRAIEHSRRKPIEYSRYF